MFNRFLNNPPFFLLILVWIGVSNPGKAQDYNASMKRGMAVMDSSFVHAASYFGQASRAKPKDWLPQYYKGLCEVLEAFRQKGKAIDAWCDKAMASAAAADSLSKNNSEVYVLKSMCASARIQVNTVARGQKYGAQAYTLADQAIRLDAANPRGYLQKAMAIYYTPPLFGGGGQKAKPVFETALQKFRTFRPASSLHPAWGEDRAAKFLNEINKKTTK